jgi:hypothetical protein
MLLLGGEAAKGNPMPLKINIDEEELNQVGTLPDDDRPLPFDAGYEPTQDEVSDAALQRNLEEGNEDRLKQAIWGAINKGKRSNTKFTAQRDLLQQLLKAGRGKELLVPVDTHAEAVRVRMRFYRCKDELRKAGNTLFDEIVITITEEGVLLLYPHSIVPKAIIRDSK